LLSRTNVISVSSTDKEYVVGTQMQPVRSSHYLLWVLLPGHVHDPAHRLGREVVRHLDDQSGLTYAGLACQQDDAPSHQASTQHTVQLNAVQLKPFRG
jgi:hypothetical protein